MVSSYARLARRDQFQETGVLSHIPPDRARGGVFQKNGERWERWGQTPEDVMFSRVSRGLSPWIPHGFHIPPNRAREYFTSILQGFRGVCPHGFEAPQVDITLAKELLGWEPKVPLREGLAKTIAYFRTR